MLHQPARLSILAAALAFGATGFALALTGLGLPFLAATALAAAAAGVVQYAALSTASSANIPAATALRTEIEAYRASAAVLRHDLRGVLSPALMVSDRLLNHKDPAVQRAGQAVVRSIERATSLLASHKDALTPEDTPDGAARPAE